MLKKISKFLQYKEVKVTVVVGMLILIIFSGYLKYIGLPATNSQNIFNDGVRAYERGDYEAAKGLFIEADELWPHSQVDEYLSKIESQ